MKSITVDTLVRLDFRVIWQQHRCAIVSMPNGENPRESLTPDAIVSSHAKRKRKAGKDRST